MEHLDEMSCMLYLEGQLDRARALEVSNHTQTCASCRTLLRAMEREARLLTRAMLEEEEPLPARIASFQERARRSMQWIWMVTFGLAATALYAVYTGYIEPLQQRLEQAGFGGTSLLSMLIFQGSFWKGWQSMLSLVELLALITVVGFAAAAVRRRIRRGSALALVLAGFCALLASAGAPAASAAEFRSGPSVEIAKDETLKSDLYFTGQQLSVDGTIDGDLYVWGQEVTVRGHVTGDVFAFVQTARIEGQVDGSVRGFCNNITISGTVDRSLMAWAQVIHVDSRGSVGRSVTSFSQTLSVDGKVARDMLIFNQSTRIAGSVGGDIKERGESLTVEDTAKVDGVIRFEGEKEPVVSKGAKLSAPVDFTKHVQHHEEFGKSKAFWSGVLFAAFVLYGMALFLAAPEFGKESVHAAENIGASLGLGLLVFFGVLIGCIISMVTLVGLFVGFASLFVWAIAVYAAQPVAGALIGQWILGRTREAWPLIGRMILGVLIIRIATLVPAVGWLIKLGVIWWGLGAIALALYRRYQPPLAAQPAYVSPVVPPLAPVGGATAV
jgi:cytoskeletal protein CcmA (bactofilin family)